MLSAPRLMSYVFHFATILAVAIGAASVRAEKAAEFFRNKAQLTIVVPTSAGGGYDSYARLLGKYMSKYLPGPLAVIVTNMPGGGGIAAANYLYNIAPKDGSVFAILDRGSPTAPLLYGADSKSQFDATRFGWIGSAMSESGMGVVSAHAPATTIEEAKIIPLFFGATGPETDPAMDARLVNDLFGTKIKTINGYKGQPEEFLALEKGEVHGLFMSGWSGPGRAHVLEEKAKGQLKTLVQMSLARDPQVPDTPTILELVKDPGDRQMVELLLNRLALGRPFVTPPGVPQERLQLLREAFRQAINDPELRAEAASQKLAIHPTEGEPAQKLIEQMYQVPPALLERTRKIVRVSSEQ